VTGHFRLAAAELTPFLRAGIAVALLHFTTPCVGLCDDREAIANPQQYAATRVFKIRASGQNGSVVLVKLEERDGTKFAYFATCYHVLSGSATFAIYTWDGNKVTDNTPATVYRRWNQELVVVRVPLTYKGVVDAVSLDDYIKPDTLDSLLASPTGYAIGYPGYDDRKPQYLEVRIDGERTGTDPALNIVNTKAEKPKDGTDVDLSKLELRYLTKERTHPGMSGGLVVDRYGRFAGLIVGSVRRDFCLMIPAHVVVLAVSEASKDPNELPKYDRSLFLVRSPFNEDVEQHLSSSTNYYADVEQDTLARMLQGLTSAQKEALLENLRASLRRLTAEATKGNAAADEALEEARRLGDYRKVQELLVKRADEAEAQLKDELMRVLSLDREIAAVALLRSDFAEARRRLEFVTQHDKSDWNSLNQLGIAEFRQDNIDSAHQRFLDLVTRSDKESVWYVKGLANIGGLVQLRRGAYDDAEKTLQLALQIAKARGYLEVEGVIHGNLSLLDKFQNRQEPMMAELVLSIEAFDKLVSPPYTGGPVRR
jgi:tetratricopeptide (TPR) repeat protein